MAEAMFDVIEIDLDTKKVRMMGGPESKPNALAILRMAIGRRGNDNNTFTTVPTGKYADGDTYRPDGGA